MHIFIVDEKNSIYNTDQISNNEDQEKNTLTSPIQKLSEASQALTQYLRENSQSELTLHYVIDTVGASIQHITTQNMGHPVGNEVQLLEFLYQ